MSTINPNLIDPTKPEEGQATTASVRANMTACQTNFTAADDEIDVVSSGLSAHEANMSNPHMTTAAAVGAPASDPTGIGGAAGITNIISITQAGYDALTPDAQTLYLIKG